jgi:hypothetical protein
MKSEKRRNTANPHREFNKSAFKRCPKTCKVTAVKMQTRMGSFLYPLVGFVALLWFLVRVIPKPRRIIYPCQQVAAGMGTSFILWIVSVASSVSIYTELKKKNIVAAMMCSVCVLSTAFVGTRWGIAFADGSSNQELLPAEGVNKPLGTARGIFPGRVVWTQDFRSTSWDGTHGFWWDDRNTDQDVVDTMMSVSLRKLTEAKTNAQAWDRLFRHHNVSFGRGNRGYRTDEKIVIKINCNADSKADVAWGSRGYPSPHVVYALVKELIDEAGVPGANIVITDPSRHIGIPLYSKIRSNPKLDYQQVTFEEKMDRGEPQRVKAVPDTTSPIYFDMPDKTTMKFYLPTSFTEASYIINLAQVRPHRVFGVTLNSKNLFGVVYDPKRKTFNPASLHAFALWGYGSPNKQGDPHSHPVLLGHKMINDKTFLYMLDGLFTAKNQGLDVVKWSTMRDDWFSSLLMSQDPAALESVGYDFIVSEPSLTKDNPGFNGNADSYLHEAALAPNSPSGKKYDPEHDGSILQSLGVHEHWNNALEKKYSRNLGVGKGIELVSIMKTGEEGERK